MPLSVGLLKTQSTEKGSKLYKFKLNSKRMPFAYSKIWFYKNSWFILVKKNPIQPESTEFGKYI